MELCFLAQRKETRIKATCSIIIPPCSKQSYTPQSCRPKESIAKAQTGVDPPSILLIPFEMKQGLAWPSLWHLIGCDLHCTRLGVPFSMFPVLDFENAALACRALLQAVIVLSTNSITPTLSIRPRRIRRRRCCPPPPTSRIRIRSDSRSYLILKKRDDRRQ